MSILRADSIRDRAGTGAPDFPNGLTGTLTGNVTGTASTATALSGTPNITVGTVTGTDATFSGNLTVQGTTTTIDTAVTSVDSLAVDGSVGIGTTNPTQLLHLSKSSASQILLERTGSNPSQIAIKNEGELLEISQNTDGIIFKTGSSPAERVRIDSSGRLLHGTNSSSSNISAVFQGNSDNSASAAGILLQRGTATPNDGQELGNIYFADSAAGTGAIILGKRDGGTWSGSSKPGRIEFWTTPDGATSGNERLRITSTGTAIFKNGLAEKYRQGTTLAAASNDVALSLGNVHRFTTNESGAKTVNFTGVHSTLANGESVSFTVILTPNNSGYINAATVDGVAPYGGLKWSGGSAPSASSSGRDVYTFTIFKDGSATNSYEIFGAMTNYA